MISSRDSSDTKDFGTFLHSVELVLSSFLGLFFAYVIQQSYSFFSNASELSSYISAHKLTDYYNTVSSLIKECYGFSNLNAIITIFSFGTFLIFLTVLYFANKLLKEVKYLSILTVVIASLIVWFLEPLISLCSSFENPNIAFLIGWGNIPASDVAVISKNIVALDRFRLFSRAYYFSFEMTTFATFILISSLVFPKLWNHKLTSFKKSLITISTLSPLLILILFWLFSPSLVIIYGSPLDQGPIYIEGLGDISLGRIIPSFLECLQLFLTLLMSCVWITSLLWSTANNSRKGKMIIKKLRNFFQRFLHG